MENRSGDLHTKRKKNDDVQHWNGVRYAESVCCYKAYQHPSSSSDTSDTSDTSFSSASISLLPHGLFSPFFLYNFSLFFSFISRCFHSPPPLPSTLVSAAGTIHHFPAEANPTTKRKWNELMIIIRLLQLKMKCLNWSPDHIRWCNRFQ